MPKTREIKNREDAMTEQNIVDDKIAFLERNEPGNSELVILRVILEAYKNDLDRGQALYRKFYDAKDGVEDAQQRLSKIEEEIIASKKDFSRNDQHQEGA